MLPGPAGHQKPTMDRIILIACVALLVLNLYSEVVLATNYDDSANKEKEDDTMAVWSNPRMGRRKRNMKEDTYKIIEQELAELWGILEETPTAVVTINGNDKFLCRNLQGKRDTLEFIPRLGRNLEELSGNEKWLREAMSDEGDERSPPFAPRLGRRISPYSPRLGRDA